MSLEIFEKLLNPVTMMAGEQEILSLGEGAVPLLRGLLDGSARNAFGVPYRNLGLPLRCALEVAMRLGERANGLEALIVLELQRGDPTAAKVLAEFRRVSESAISGLSEALTSENIELRYEAAYALMQLNCDFHPAVVRNLAQSSGAQTAWNKVKLRLS
ncbi:hypothetical protein [Burkholderia sp. Ac-20379]|uniref:hypothetical protein n=1 Tax=Burkholderia sp. Ac-20379 TaxID=2703900 RepID=UPI0019800991|nr:hypothetical protein [Burkholderia sp. Ac-20379]MBN3727000.1 hypothetical protein [Burkholderia sp. Ac-20379]